MRGEKLITSTALSRPLVLQASPKTEPTASAEPESAELPNTPFADALAAVYAQAGLAAVVEPAPKAKPPEPYTPEKVVAFLSSLPDHLSTESCHSRMEAELRQCQIEDPTELVGDAAVALVTLRQELSQQSQEFEEASRTMRWRIELLESELARLRELQMQHEAEGQATRQDLLVRIDEMTGVIVFFDSYQSYLLRRDQTSSYEAPEFPDEETALRLLSQRDDSRV